MSSYWRTAGLGYQLRPENKEVLQLAYGAVYQRSKSGFACRVIFTESWNLSQCRVSDRINHQVLPGAGRHQGLEQRGLSLVYRRLCDSHPRQPYHGVRRELRVQSQEIGLDSVG